MKNKKIMSAFLSLTLGMTSFAGVPMSANAASVDVTTVTEGNKGVSLTTTSAPEMTANTTTSVTTLLTHVTTVPSSADKYEKAAECAVNVRINVRDYDTGKTIENVNVKVVRGYEGVEEECSFNTTENPDFVHTFRYSINSLDDKGIYEVILDNLPENYNFTNNSTSWMLYLDEKKAKEYEGKTYNYNLDIHPVISDVQGTVTGVTTTSPVTHNNTTTYHSKTTATASTTTKTVTKKNESTFSFEQDKYDFYTDETYIIKINNPDRVTLDYEVEDRNYAVEKILYPTYVYVDTTSMTGTTKIKAIGENGKTAEAVINVIERPMTATTTTGTGTTTETTTTYVRSTPGAGMSFNDENSSMYIKANELKEFTFSAFAASDVEFKFDSPDIKIFDVEFEGKGTFTPSDGKVTISCKYDAEPQSITFYSYTKHFMTGEYFKDSHSLLIVDDSFTATTTIDPDQPTTTTMTTTTGFPHTTYVTHDGSGSIPQSTMTSYVSATTETSLTTTFETTTLPAPVTHETFLFDTVLTYPTKIEYCQGEDLDFTGIVIRANSANKSKKGTDRNYEDYYFENILNPDYSGKLIVKVEDAAKNSVDAVKFNKLAPGEYTVKVSGELGDYYCYDLCRNVDFSYKVTIKGSEAPDNGAVYGDANCDGELSMADAVIIMQYIANPDKFGVNGTDKNHITEQGKKNADITGKNDGITNADALAIQKKLLGL